jgi:hypothetical protein
VRRALKWNTRGAVQRSFSGKEPIVSRRRGGRLADDVVDEEGEDDDAEDDGDDDNDEEEDWDIDPDPIDTINSRDSGIGASEQDSGASSPLTRIVNAILD